MRSRPERKDRPLMKCSRLRLRRSTSGQPAITNNGSRSLGERRLHYERGSTIYATDGRVGVLPKWLSMRPPAR